MVGDFAGVSISLVTTNSKSVAHKYQFKETFLENRPQTVDTL